MIEEGYVQPGWMVVASDSHSNMYGALGCLGTPMVRTDAAGLWATGATWWQVPPVARVTLTGALRRERGVSGKDVVLALCGLFGRDEVLNHAVEFAGEGVVALGMEERMTVANMTTEWGALAGVFPVDACTVDFLAQRAARLRAKYGGMQQQQQQQQEQQQGQAIPARVLASEAIVRELGVALQQQSQQQPERAAACVPPSVVLGEEDEGQGGEEARYAKELVLDLSKLPPLVAGPNAIKAVQPAGALERARVPVHKAYIVSCVNSRVGDLAAAAAVLKGKRVAPGVELYVAAASSEVEAESRARGDWQALVDAGGFNEWRVVKQIESFTDPYPTAPTARRHRAPLRLRALRGAGPGAAAAGGSGHLRDQPQLQGPDGRPRLAGLPRLPRGGGGLGAGGPHRAPAFPAERRGGRVGARVARGGGGAPPGAAERRGAHHHRCCCRCL